jgi:Fe-S oxidoreductase
MNDEDIIDDLEELVKLNKSDIDKINVKINNNNREINDLNYKHLDNADSCCGFGGSYFIYHPIIAIKIALKKAHSIKNTKADLILTACPSCTIGLRFNQLISFNFKKTLELRDFINNELTK